MNIIANSTYLREFPNVKFYNEPLSTDCGISLGSCFYHYRDKTEDKKIMPVTTPYFHGKNGILIDDQSKTNKIDYTYQLLHNEIEFEAGPFEVAKLLVSGNIVSILQGNAESGPRALGNRSILFDPRVSNGKDIVNKVKRREYYRPFAGTILVEHAKKWFDLLNLDESSFMMYCLSVLPEKRQQIPAIIHVDGTCRIQTISREQNVNYYNLINEFYKITGVPILFNTSFNLSGDSIVETIDDALLTLRSSEIEYLYLPEMSKLIKITNV